MMAHDKHAKHTRKKDEWKQQILCQVAASSYKLAQVILVYLAMP